MKILATIVIAPHMSVSGAVNAAISLSTRIAEFCDIDIALMSSENSTQSLGKARLIKCKSHNPLSFTQGFMPNKVRTLLFRSHISKMIETDDYDIVHIHNPIPTLEMQRIAKTCVNKRLPYVVSTHGFFEVTSGGDAYQLTHFYEKLAWKYLLQNPLQVVCDNASLVYALSPFENDILTKTLNIPVEKIRIVTNGVDPKFLQTVDAKNLQDVAIKYDLPLKNENSVPVCLFMGNHTANKGIDVLLAAFKRVKHNFVLIIGGKKRDQLDYAKIEKLSTDHQRIIFTDLVDDEDLPSLMQAADLFVYPTLSDTLPLVILEAMASKLPVLATNVGGIPYQITDESGVLVEAGNPEKFASAVDRLIADPEKLTKMGKVSQGLVRTKFDWDLSAKDAVKYYRELLRDKV